MKKKDVSDLTDAELEEAIASAKPVPKLKRAKRSAAPADPTEDAPAPSLPATFADLRPAAMDRMAARRQGKEWPVPVPWPTLADQLGGGLWPGVYILVGNTGTGRSQFAMQMVFTAINEGVPAAYVGLELDELQLVARVNSLASYWEDTPTHWSYAYLGEADAPQIKANWREWPLHLATAGPYGWNAGEELPALAEAMRAKYPEERTGARPFLIVVDFLQIVNGTDDEGRPLDMRQRIGRAAYAARAVARDRGAAVVLISSTARENYKFDAPKKELEDQFGAIDPASFIGMGKESGEIEYAADCVLILGKTGERTATGRPVALGIAKTRAKSQRASNDPYVHLRFDGSYFHEAPPPKYAGAKQKTKPTRTSKAADDDDDTY